MNIPDDLRYSKEHEWVRREGEVAVIGITDFAQEQLGDIVLVDLPAEGTEVAKDETFATVESVKSVSDVYAPVSGTVVEVNELLRESPEIVNEDPYDEGWMAKIRLASPDELDDLLDAKAYKDFIEELGE